jgi:hypothetical protein
LHGREKRAVGTQVEALNHAFGERPAAQDLGLRVEIDVDIVIGNGARRSAVELVAKDLLRLLAHLDGGCRRVEARLQHRHDHRQCDCNDENRRDQESVAADQRQRIANRLAHAAVAFAGVGRGGGSLVDRITRGRVQRLSLRIS